MVTRMLLGLRCHRVWVASTCSTSLEPMPNASAPSAPCVAVWLSPHTSSIPGSVSPCSGPITCTMPRRTSPCPKCTIPCSAEWARSDSTIPRISASGAGAPGEVST